MLTFVYRGSPQGCHCAAGMGAFHRQEEKQPWLFFLEREENFPEFCHALPHQPYFLLAETQTSALVGARTGERDWGSGSSVCHTCCGTSEPHL